MLLLNSIFNSNCHIAGRNAIMPSRLDKHTVVSPEWRLNQA